MTGLVRPSVLALVSCLAAAVGARAQQPSLLEQSRSAERGLFDLCLQDAPDAARVAEHGEVWGWPRFMGYLEHPEGYRRQAGGESRRVFHDGDQTAFVEATVQSGVVDTAQPADVRYFRCNAASDQPVNADMEAYFSGKYGAPASKSSATVWLTGAAKAADPADDDGVAKAVATAGPGAQGLRIELTRENGLDRVKLSLFRNGPPEAADR